MSFEQGIAPPTVTTGVPGYMGGGPYYYPPPPQYYAQPNTGAMLMATSQQAALMQGQAMAQGAAAAAQLTSNIMSKAMMGSGTSGSQPLNQAMQIAEWMKSGRYDFPHGGEIDTFHNRLCFDEVCKHDPEMTSSLSMEWLRRAVPVWKSSASKIAKIERMHAMVPKPDLRYNLVSYGFKSGSVRVPSGGIDLKVQYAISPPVELVLMRRNEIKCFI